MMSKQINLILVLALGLIGLLAWSTRAALAEEMGLRLRRPALVLESTPDPHLFLQELTVVPPRPIVALTIDDAVAQELLLEARSMSEIDALRTAQALCEEARMLG